MSETKISNREAQVVAEKIKKQITTGVLMSLGASEFMYTTEQRGGLTFKARIAPKGQSRARVMRVTVILTGRDDYEISVGYMRGGRGMNRYDFVPHYTAEGIYNDQLPQVLLALDS